MGILGNSWARLGNGLLVVYAQFTVNKTLREQTGTHEEHACFPRLQIFPIR